MEKDDDTNQKRLKYETDLILQQMTNNIATFVAMQIRNTPIKTVINVFILILIPELIILAQ